MIYLDNLGSQQKGRLWVNECPEMKSKIIDIMERSINGVGGISYGGKSIVLELLLPRNASNYALLGATYTPSDSNELNVKINVGISDDEVLKDNLAFKSDEVHIGIPAEYASMILDSAVDTLKDFKISAGTLSFNTGAHGYTGSSKMIFSRVTKILVKLIFKDIIKLSEEELKELVALELSTTSW
jgi:hypothetical protein